MSNLTVMSSQHFVSFMLSMGDEGSIGCHIPQSDAVEFVNCARSLVNNKEDFPEAEFETSSVNVEGMGAGDSVMFCFKNKGNEKKIQFAIEKDICRELVFKIQDGINTIIQIHGPLEPCTREKWKFFDFAKAV